MAPPALREDAHGQRTAPRRLRARAHSHGRSRSTRRSRARRATTSCARCAAPRAPSTRRRTRTRKGKREDSSAGTRSRSATFSAREHDAEDFLEWYSVREGGNFVEEATGRPTGLSVLHLSKKIPSSPVRIPSCSASRAALLAARAKRIPPALDDKRVAGWNALAVSGFAVAARALAEPRYLEAARVGARFLLNVARLPDGVLARTWKDGEAKIPAFLEDEAFLALALLDLADAEGPGAAGIWHEEAKASVASLRRAVPAQGRARLHVLRHGARVAPRERPRPLRQGRPVGLRRRGAGARAPRARHGRPRPRARGAGRRRRGRRGSWRARRTARSRGSSRWRRCSNSRTDSEKRKRRRRFLRVGREEKKKTAECRPVRVEAVAVEPKVVRGEKGALRVRISIAPGWHLQGPDGLRIEAEGARGSESGFTFEEILSSRARAHRRPDRRRTHGLVRDPRSKSLFLCLPEGEEGKEGRCACASRTVPAAKAPAARRVALPVRPPRDRLTPRSRLQPAAAK